MRLSLFKPALWPFTVLSTDFSVRADADELMMCCGDGALEAAELNALHEDLGLKATSRPGHWGRVAQDIRRRTNRPDLDAPRADFGLARSA